MSQYDASAEPLWRCFEQSASHPPFRSLPNIVDLNLKNTVVNKLSQMSEKFNFNKEDRVPDEEFNVILWGAVHGINSHYPAPVHSAFFSAGNDEDKD